MITAADVLLACIITYILYTLYKVISHDDNDPTNGGCY